jgi:hypothetical protein
LETLGLAPSKALSLARQGELMPRIASRPPYGGKRPQDLATRFLWRRVVFWLFIIGLAAGLIGYEEAARADREPSDLVLFGTFGGLLVYGLFYLVFWRCPGCGTHFGRKINPRQCSKCAATV